MVRETKLTARVEGVTAEAFYEIVYADPAPIKRYHAATNACHHAVATPWLDGRRTVHFTLQVALPTAFQKIIGAGPIPVREVQTVSWDSGCSFAVTSEPEMSFPGAASFPTTVTVAVRQSPDPTPSVDLTALVRCSAGVPWVMQKTVEGLMVDQAQASLSGFLEFCKTICCEHLSAPPPLPKLMAAPAPDAGLEAAATAVATPPAVPPPTTPPVPASASDASSSERSASGMGAASSSSPGSEDEEGEEEDVFHDIPSSASSDVSASDSEASLGVALDEATHRVAEAAARLRQWPPAAAAAGEGSSGDERQQQAKGRASPEARPPPGGYVQRYVAAAAASGGSSPAVPPRAPRRQARHSEAAGAVTAGTTAADAAVTAAAVAAATTTTVAAADASYLTAAGAEALAARVAELVEVQNSTHRLLRDMEARLASVEIDLLRAKAYQEGAAAALRAVGGARFATTALALVATAAAASSVTALLLMRRRG